MAARDVSVLPSRPLSGGRRVLSGDRIFAGGLGIAVGLLLVLMVLLLIGMLVDAWPALSAFGPAFLTTSTWNPVTHVFGVLPAIYGTIVTSAIAMVVALPIGLGAAVFLAELAPRRIADPLSFLIELLAAIPSVIVGMWGLFVLVPAIRPVEAWLAINLGFIPLFSGAPIGLGLLAGGLVLAIMILPILTAIIRDVLLAVPQSQREAMVALGATRWETISRAILPYGRSGIIGGIMLALGRALGETLAVTMVIGNTFTVGTSLFSTGSTLASLIASQFREADSDLYLSSLVAAGLVLFLVVLVVNVLARMLVQRVTKRALGIGGTG